MQLSPRVPRPDVPLQPLAQQARRLETTLSYLGQPIASADRRLIDDALAAANEEAGVQHCIVEDHGPLDWRMASRVEAVLRRWRPSIVQTHGYKAAAVAYFSQSLASFFTLDRKNVSAPLR